jgi:acyl carrier protein
MEKADIIKTVKNLLVEEFEIEEANVFPEAHLKNDLGLESLDFVDIAVVVKKEFGLTLKGEEMASIRTLNDLYDYIYNSCQKM